MEQMICRNIHLRHLITIKKFPHRQDGDLCPQLSQVTDRNSKFRLRHDLHNCIFNVSFKLHAYRWKPE